MVKKNGKLEGRERAKLSQLIWAYTLIATESIFKFCQFICTSIHTVIEYIFFVRYEHIDLESCGCLYIWSRHTDSKCTVCSHSDIRAYKLPYYVFFFFRMHIPIYDFQQKVNTLQSNVYLCKRCFFFSGVPWTCFFIPYVLNWKFSKASETASTYMINFILKNKF